MGRLRFLFLPLGLFCLLAVGAHAAADAVDDRLLWLIDRVDGWFDALVSRWAFTAGWVDWVDLEDRTRLARALALVWELLAVAVLAYPSLSQAGVGTPPRRWKPLLRDLWRRPTVLRVLRPLCTAAVVLAGACAVGRMVHGATYLHSRGLLTDAVAGPLSRGLALAALLGVLGALGVRAVLLCLQRADRLALEKTARQTSYVKILAQGLVGTSLVLPLAVAAVLDASPLLSFFR